MVQPHSTNPPVNFSSSFGALFPSPTSRPVPFIPMPILFDKLLRSFSQFMIYLFAISNEYLVNCLLENTLGCECEAPWIWSSDHLVPKTQTIALIFVKWLNRKRSAWLFSHTHPSPTPMPQLGVPSMAPGF